MQTPTTTTRENSGAPVTMLIDHARDADAFEDDGVLGRRRADRFGGAPERCHGTQRDAAQLLHRADRELEHRGRVGRGGRGLGRVAKGESVRGVDDDVGAASRWRARGDRREKSLAITVRTPLRLEHADHGEPDRPAADHDGDLALLDLAAPHGVPADGHRLGERRYVGRQAVRDGEGERLLDEHLLRVARRARRR